ncbi:radical SAM protein [Clostridium estertheticum]|uniref:radical SAM protein n=1 Tax=Clostridium estertheticum TaxID=238834 RepID=UPI001C0B4586|nr:radical SAM protein [Clostridium estertheticum]MBU3201562.1 radical SAM protein [Clostridium estertheticum]WAG66262.1 radical SAM protein [Clostridium estertheticum]
MVTEVYFEVENNCLLNCKHCSSYSLKGIKQRGYGLEDIKNFLDVLDDPIHVYLTGGEPLLNGNNLEMIRDLNEYRSNLNIGIFTCGIIEKNGILSNISYPEALKLRESGLKNCYVSVYHYDYKKHEEITNLEGSFDLTMLSIKNMLLAGVMVKVHLVINRFNVNCLDETIRVIASLGVQEIRILRIVETGNAIKNWDTIGVSYSEQNAAVVRVINKLHTYPIKITVSGFPDLTPCRPFEGAVKCQGGTNVMYTTFEGEIYPCACTKKRDEFSICNISEINKILEYRKSIGCKFNDKCLNPST